MTRWRSAVRFAPLVVFVAYLFDAAFGDVQFPLRARIGQTFGPYSYVFIVNTIFLALAIGSVAIARGGLRRGLAELGISADPWRPLLFGLAATAPTAIGFALTARVSASFTARELVLLCGYFPFIEEVLFRALAFGQLYRRFGWNFWAAALVPAVCFALGHAAQGGNIGEIAGIMAITGLGSVVFSYFFLRFGWNIWAPVALHAFLNLWWTVFTVNQNALGGASDNILRFGSLALAFLLVRAAARIPVFRIFAPEVGVSRRISVA
jgi:hypothetical protein